MRVVVTFPTFCVAPESSSGKSEKSRQEIWAFSVLLWQQQSTTPVWLYSSSSASLKHVIKTWKPSDSVYSIRGWKRRWSFFLFFFFFWSSVTYHACVEYVGLTLSQGGPPALCRTKRKWDLLLCFLNAFFFFFFFFFYDFLELVCHFSFLLRSGLRPEEEPGSISRHLFSSWICKNTFLTNSSTLKKLPGSKNCMKI